jgi:hypothetical protein
VRGRDVDEDEGPGAAGVQLVELVKVGLENERYFCGGVVV